MAQPAKLERTYVYLARRDRKSIRLLTVLPGDFPGWLRVEDITKADYIPSGLIPSLRDAAESHRMDWDMYIESARDYGHLKEKLEGRGYACPSYMKPAYPATSGKVVIRQKRGGHSGGEGKTCRRTPR